jgi:hypothetical protein
MTTEIEELLKPLRLAVAEQVKKYKNLFLIKICFNFYANKGRFSQETKS